MADQPSAANVASWPECELLRAQRDGSLVVLLDGEERTLVPAGVELKHPPSAAYFELVGRLQHLSQPMRCRIIDPEVEPVPAQIAYFGWHDKSGDAWLILADTLIERGLAFLIVGS